MAKTDPAVDPAAARRGRRNILLLALVFFGPLMLAALMYYGVLDFRPASTTNYGRLIDPPITLDPDATEPTGMRGRWTLIVPVRGRCESVCRARLQEIRDVRLVLGAEADRVTRVLLSDSAPPSGDWLSAEQPGLVVVSPGSGAWEPLWRVFEELTLPGVYLVDPLGNVMMAYPADPDQKLLLKDLKKLLKLSRIG
jgi:cytochrome oxidase Cu insertion factor (SCO1/SenC/PrrC family)